MLREMLARLRDAFHIRLRSVMLSLLRSRHMPTMLSHQDVVGSRLQNLRSCRSCTLTAGK